MSVQNVKLLMHRIKLLKIILKSYRQHIIF